MTPERASVHEAAITAALNSCRWADAERAVSDYLAAAGALPPERSADLARQPWFRARYLAAQAALRAADLARCAARLTVLLDAADRLSEPLALDVRLLAAEVAARLKQRDAAAQHLAAACRQPERSRRDVALYLRELRVRLWLGEVGALATELADCDRRLDQAGQLANRVLLRVEEGRAREAADDLAGAEQCWRAAEQLSRPLGASPYRGDVLLQLGRLAHLRGQFQAARDAFAEARSCLPDGSPQAFEVALRTFVVLLELHPLGTPADRQPVAGAFARMLAQFPDPPAEEVAGLVAVVRTVLEESGGGSLEAEAYREAVGGDRRLARDLYRREYERTGVAERRARLAFGAGILALADDDQDDARRWLGCAEELARRHALPETLWPTLRGLGELAARRGADAEARLRFEEAVAVAEAAAEQFRDSVERAQARRRHLSALDYLFRAACRNDDAAQAFHYQELQRGRLLLDLLQVGAAGDPAILDRFPALRELERPPAGVADLETFLAGQSASAGIPRVPTLDEFRKCLAVGELYLAPGVVGDDLFLLAVRRQGPVRIHTISGGARPVLADADRWRTRVAEQIRRYETPGFGLGPAERAALDACLDELGGGGLGTAVAAALNDQPVRRIVWVPCRGLHGVPLAAFRQAGRYLIERCEVVEAFSGALVARQSSAKPARGRWRALVVSGSHDPVHWPLPGVVVEGAGVAAALARCRWLHQEAALRPAIRAELPRCRVLHLACHATFEPENPLAARIFLPGGDIWRAAEWLADPVAGLPLVVLSVCRSAQVGEFVGNEVFGLVAGVLAAGVRAVVAGFWPVADREAVPFMWQFYRNTLTCDLAGALAATQRAELARPGASPLFWANFSLFGDPAAIPAPPFWLRWWRYWRQWRHERTCRQLTSQLES